MNANQHRALRDLQYVRLSLSQRAFVRFVINRCPLEFAGWSFHKVYHAVRKFDVENNTGPQFNNPHPVET